MRLPAPPGWTRRSCHCLAAPPLAPATPTCGPLPSLGLLPADFAGPRVTDPTAGGTSPVSCDLRPTAHVARGCHPSGLARHVPPSRGATITTALVPSFRGPERGSCSPTTPCGLFAVRPRVFRRTHWQRLGGALVVELFAFPLFLHGIPDSCRRAGPAGFPVGYSPRQQGYADVTGLAPELPRGCRPRPPDGILTRFESHRPDRR